MHTLLICVASSFPVHFACSSFSFNPSLSVFSNHSSALTNNYQPLSGFLCLLLFSFHLIQFAYFSLFLSFVHINPLPPLLSPLCLCSPAIYCMPIILPPLSSLWKSSSLQLLFFWRSLSSCSGKNTITLTFIMFHTLWQLIFSVCLVVCGFVAVWVCAHTCDFRKAYVLHSGRPWPIFPEIEHRIFITTHQGQNREKTIPLSSTGQAPQSLDFP